MNSPPLWLLFSPFLRLSALGVAHGQGVAHIVVTRVVVVLNA
jgi:hypothetical protein